MDTPPPGPEAALVYTDVEGSTALWERAPDAMAEALPRHEAMVRRLVELYAGYEVRSEGDSFLLGFATVGAAAGFALDLQRALDAERWPGAIGGLRVRVAVHHGQVDQERSPVTGRVELIGPAVQRGARIAEVGHGGQILVTAEAAALLGSTPTGAALADLGEHRVLPLPEAVRLHELRPAGAAPFPPLRAMPARRTNVGEPPGTLIGRAAELGAIRDALPDPGVVTLLGPAGAGKTRLAQEVAWQDPLGSAERGGVFWVDLTEATSEEDVLRTLGAVLRVRTSGSGDVAARLGLALAGRGGTTLVLDNCEGSAAAVASVVVRLAARSPETRFLATSREPLGLEGERTVRVEPLSEEDGVALFLARARAERADLELSPEDHEAIWEIVARLDGLPLAIELAAARVAVLSPRHVLRRLARRFDLLRRPQPGAPRRQTALRAALDDSWDLLDDAERRALRRVAVFRGGFDAAAAEALLGGVAVAEALVRRSLLRRVAGERYAPYEAVRAYAADLLGEEQGPAEHAHAAFYARYGTELADALFGPEGEQASDRLAAEVENLLVAQRRMLDRAPALAIEATLAAHRVLQHQWPAPPHLALLDAAIGAAEDLGDPSLLARALVCRCRRFRNMGKLAEAWADGERAAAMARGHGEPAVLAQCLVSLALTAFDQSRVDTAEELLVEALALEGADRNGILVNLVDVYRRQGLPALARSVGRIALRAAGHLPLRKATLLGQLGVVAWSEGRLDEAKRLYEASVHVMRGFSDRRNLAILLGNLAAIELETGSLDAAEAHFEESRRVHAELGHRLQEAQVLSNQATLHVERRRFDQARRYLTDALEAALDVGSERQAAIILGNRAALQHRLGALEEARADLESALAIARRQRFSALTAFAAAHLAGVRGALGDEEGAREALAEGRRAVGGEPGLEVLLDAMEARSRVAADPSGAAAVVPALEARLLDLQSPHASDARIGLVILGDALQ